MQLRALLRRCTEQRLLCEKIAVLDSAHPSIRPSSAMRYFVSLFLCLLAMLTGTANAAEPVKIDWNDKELHWLSYEQGMAKLKQTGQRGILIVYADWCSTCKAYSRIFRKPEVVSALAGLVLMRVDTDREPKTSKKYGDDGQYVPRTFALSPNGKILKQAYLRKDKYAYFIGTEEPDELLEFLARTKAAKHQATLVQTGTRG